MLVTLCVLIALAKSKAKKSLHRCRLFSIWLHDLDSNRRISTCFKMKLF